jgi:hypothetical protein
LFESLYHWAFQAQEYMTAGVDTHLFCATTAGSRKLTIPEAIN